MHRAGSVQCLPWVPRVAYAENVFTHRVSPQPQKQSCSTSNLLNDFNLNFLLCVWVFCSNAYVSCVCLIPMEVRRGHWMSWDWSYSYELPCGRWELNPCPLEEWPVLLNTESSLKSLLLFLIVCMCVRGVCARCLQRPDSDNRTPGVGVIDSCKLPVSAGNRTWVLCDLSL